MTTYRKDIDALKGIAIIAIVFFHLGILSSGYLGVDVFFVISGFLVLPKMCCQIIDGNFSYFSFLKKRYLRMAPLVVLAGIVCLLAGFWGMLPDSYENLAESVVASNLFAENILSAITAHSYWNVINDYKPLMHLWYVGVLFQFYVLCPIILKCCFWLVRKLKGVVSHSDARLVLGVLFAISLILYLIPAKFEAYKFYFIHCRSFELLLGGMAGYVLKDAGEEKVRSGYQWGALALLVFVMFSSLLLLTPETFSPEVIPIGQEGQRTARILLIQPRPVLLIFTVFLTAFLLRASFCCNSFAETAMAAIGKRSYSIYVWHQVLLAFYRYYFSRSLSPGFVLLFLVAVIIVSELSYRFIEKKTGLSNRSFISWLAASALVTALAFGIYLRAGVVRDVPELGITVSDAHRGMHAEYVERIYDYDKDFPTDNGKINVLVEGWSFARDMANCLLESGLKDSMSISYVYEWDESYIERIKAADMIFTFRGKDEVPSYVTSNMSDNCQIWGIGTKNYGECNGIFYRKRFSDSFKDSAVAIPASYVALNDRWREGWGENYVDFIRLAEISPGVVRILTPEGKFISQDCEHLTRAGAIWYASMINWKVIFGNTKILTLKNDSELPE